MPKAESNSTTEKNKPQTLQFVPYAEPFEDDTIDLYKLWITLWYKKWIVIGVTAVAALGSVVFALLQPSIYKAKALLLAPQVQDIQSLNVPVIQGVVKEGGNVVDVFTMFKNNLTSRILQKKFFKEYGLMAVLAQENTMDTMDEDIYVVFSKMIKIKEEEEKKLAVISIELDDPIVAAQLVNDYIKFIDTETIKVLVENMRNSITDRVRVIEYAIGSKRQMAKQRRQDRIQIYLDANKIAIDLDIISRVDTKFIVQNTQLSTTGSNPLYYRGSKALLSEIKTLNARISDDPYIVGLRDLQENLALLRSIKIPNEGMHAVTIDLAAYPPKSHFKPNRRLIVSIGTVAGLFLGTFLVFFVSFVQKRKETNFE